MCWQANKVHTKNVYKADGYAVKEMLKVTSLLYSTMKTAETALGDQIEEDNVTFKFPVAPQATVVMHQNLIMTEVFPFGLILLSL